MDPHFLIYGLFLLQDFINFHLEKETVGWIRNQYDVKPTIWNQTIYNDENPHPYMGHIAVLLSTVNFYLK